jgi:hypothetical protein
MSTTLRMPRVASSEEQERIDAAQTLLAELGLTAFALVDHGGGAVIPSKGF